MNILPDTASRCIQNRSFFNSGVVIAHDQKDPWISVSKLPPQYQEILNEEIIDEIPMRKIQCLMGVPRMGEEIAAYEHGFGLFPEEGLKKLPVPAYHAVEIGYKEDHGHKENDSENIGRRQPPRMHP